MIIIFDKIYMPLDNLNCYLKKLFLEFKIYNKTLKH